MNSVDDFVEEHGDSIFVEGHHFFEDGATLEDGPFGRLTPPPESAYELACNQFRYAAAKAQEAAVAFLEFKAFLGGNGRSEVTGLYTDEDKLNHLKSLQRTAKKWRARYYVVQRRVKATRPATVDLDEQFDAELAQRKQHFLDSVSEIEL